MLLDQIESHGQSVLQVPPTPPSGTNYSSIKPLPDTKGDDDAISWLTMGKRASQEFARLTATMWDATDVAIDRPPAPDSDPSIWLRRAAALLERADPVLVRSLCHAAAPTRPVIVVRGLPTSPVPPATPCAGVVDLAASRQAIINLHAVVGCLGLHPVAYAEESASTLHAVCPVTKAWGEVSSHGFDSALPAHTDYADRPIDELVRDQSPAAAVLAFAIERAEPGTPMQCISLHRLLSRLSPERIAAGQQEEFAVRAPAIFGSGHPPRVRRLFLPDSGSGVRCRLNLGTMHGLTARASRLLHEIREILTDAAMVEMIHVRRGDIVIMDNQRTLHRRGSFTPRWDGTDRYFIRMSAVHDCRAGLAAGPGRPWIWS
jgi:hypothetical protein